MKETKTSELGWAVCKLYCYNGREDSPCLQIVSPANSSESFYTPAESVEVFGKLSILKLRDFLNAEFPVAPAIEA